MSDDRKPRADGIWVDGSWMASSEHRVIAAAFRFVEANREALTIRSKCRDVDEAVELLHAVDRCDWPNREWRNAP